MQTESASVERLDVEADGLDSGDQSAMATAAGPVVLVTGAIAPYTNRLFEAAGCDPSLDLHVLACTELEPHRKWSIPASQSYTLQVLSGLRYHRSYTSHVYFNPSVVRELHRLRPRVIGISGFSPTMLLAGLYALVTATPLMILTDGSVATDPGQRSRIHRMMRLLLVPRAAAGICASEDSATLLSSYGLDRQRCIVVPISPAWPPLAASPSFEQRPFDVLFAGAIDDETKGIIFFVRVLELCKRLGYSLKVRVVGEGPLKVSVERRISEMGLEAQFDGYLAQSSLPAAYSSAKLLLFPSRGDAWGLVVNEAIQTATPIIGSPHAVASLELVEHFKTGRRLPLNEETWAQEVISILTRRAIWNEYSANCATAVESFSLTRAVEAFNKAIHIAQTARHPRLRA